jgi:Protein of unknown function (DUF2950)
MTLGRASMMMLTFRAALSKVVCRRRILGSLLAAALVWLALAQGAAAQQTFDTPEAAVKALLDAINKHDVDAVTAIFGAEHMDELVGPDKVQAREGFQTFAEKAAVAQSLQPNDKGGMTLVIGAEAWPFPVPLIKDGNKWRFDTETGVEEIIDRRVGENELSAIAALNEYVDAQVQYASRDRDGDDVLEYAQKIVSTPGKHDGLYWQTSDPDDASPFGPLVAEAADYLQGRQPGDPFKGYYYRILTRQGEGAPGGRYDYVINGNMIAGFAMLAFPADYGNSGVMSFIVNHQGKVYQRDLGEHTDIIAPMIVEYDPTGWDLTPAD